MNHNQLKAGHFVDFSDKNLCAVAQSTKEYLSKGVRYDPHAIHVGVFEQYGVVLEQVRQTLAFVCKVVKEDKQNRVSSRLTDVNFLAKHFDLYQWRSDQQQISVFKKNKPLLEKIPNGDILLTKYYVKKAQARYSRSPKTPYALYQIPHDEQHLSLEQADQLGKQINRFKFTKQQVLTGVLEQTNAAKPLAFLSRTDLEDSLMQGTVKTEFEDGHEKFFNVHRNNGYKYDRNLKKEQQKRYWFFKEVPGVMGYGKDANYKITIQPGVTVAGDLAYLGLGKLILLSTKSEGHTQYRLTILADTGGAFENNRYQLDFLAGFYSGWKDYYQHWRGKPDYYQAKILLLKMPVPMI